MEAAVPQVRAGAMCSMVWRLSTSLPCCQGVHCPVKAERHARCGRRRAPSLLPRIIVVVRSPCQENCPADAHPSAHKSVLKSANPAWTRSVHLDAAGQRHGQQPISGTADPGVVKQDKSSRGSIDTTKTRSGPQRVRMSSGERPIGATKGKQSDTEALCQPPPPPAEKNGGIARAHHCGISLAKLSSTRVFSAGRWGVVWQLFVK